MKNSYRIKLAFKMICIHSRKFLISLGISTLSFILLVAVMFLYKQSTYNRDTCNEVLKYGISGTGTIDVVLSGDNEMSSFRQIVMESEKFTSIGPISTGGTHPFPELVKRQAEIMSDNVDYNPRYLQVTFMDYYTLNLCDISLSEGELIDNVNDFYGSNGEKYAYIYVGSSYNIPVGTKYEIEAYDVKLVYIVAGIMKKGTRIVDEEIARGIDTGTILPNYNMDDSIILVGREETYTSRWYFSIDTDKISMDEAIAYLYEKAEACGLEIHVGSLEDSFEEVEKQTKVVRGYILKLFIMVFIVTIVVMICMQLAGIIADLSEYGIMRVGGTSQKDLMIIIFIQNIIKIGSSYIFACGIGGFLLHLTFSNNNEIRLIVNEILTHSVFFNVFLVAICMIVISSIIPMYFMKKHSINELLRRR